MDEQNNYVTVKPRANMATIFRSLGLGIIVGAADDDPSGIATYSQVGAQNGYGLLWLLVIATPMLQVVQVTCAKIGIVTRQGLAILVHNRYGLKVALFITSITALANLLTIAADIAAISAGLELVAHLRWQYFAIPITVILWYFLVYQDFNIIRKVMLLLSLSLIGYIMAGVMVHPHLPEVLRGVFIPHIEFNMGYMTAVVGLLGTTLTPYMFFFQATEEVEERKKVKHLNRVTIETTLGMIMSNVVSFFIILSTAATVHVHHGTVDTVEQAAQALAPFAGKSATYLFAAGIIGSGMLAVPVLAASTASMIGETVGWRVGMNRTYARARGFYNAITVVLILGLLITLVGIPPMKALFWSQVFNGIVSPILLVFIFLIGADEKLMGKHIISLGQKCWGWFTITIMASAVVLMIWSWVSGGR